VGPTEGGNPRDLSGHRKNVTGGYSPLETIEEGMPWTQCMADIVSTHEFKEKGEEKEVNKKPGSVSENWRMRCRVDQEQTVNRDHMSDSGQVSTRRKRGEGAQLPGTHMLERRGVSGHSCLLFSKAGAWCFIRLGQGDYKTSTLQ